jgi:hypothetical protein
MTTIQQDVLKLSPLCGILNQGCAPFSNKPQYVWLVDFILIQQHIITSYGFNVA